MDKGIFKGQGMKNALGNILKEYMTEKGIRQLDLCKGLCSASTMSKYLNGKRRMDRLMLNAVLQRLGVAADDFITALTKDEYDYFEWKLLILQAIQRGAWSEAEELAKKQEKGISCGNEALEMQFGLIVKGILAKEYEHDPDRAAAFFRQAIHITMPDFEIESMYSGLWSRDEAYIILTLYQIEADRKDMAEQLDRFLGGLKSSPMDIREKVRIYPQIVSVYGELLIKQKRCQECAALCGEVLELMRQHNSAFMLAKVLAMYIAAMERTGRGDSLQREREWLEAWAQIQKLAGFSQDYEGLAYLANFGQEIELIHEIVKKGRKEAGIRQNEFSKALNCDYVSLSRIENGIRAPRRTRYERALEELNIRCGYYYGEIRSDSFAAYRLKYDIDRGLIDRKWDKIEPLLDMLAEKLDMSMPENRQYVMDCRNMAEYMMKKIPPEEYLKKEMEAAANTIDLDNPRREDRIFSAMEIRVIIHIASAYRNMGRADRAIELLEFLLAFYSESEVRKEYHFRQVILILHNLCVYYADTGKWDRVKELCLRGICCDVSCHKGRGTAGFLNFYGCAAEKEGDTAASIKYYWLAAEWSELFYNTNTLMKARSNYERLLKAEGAVRKTI